MQTILQDARYGFRTLRQNPAFTLAAIATLALGIGANAAIFSVADAVLFKGLPISEADRLVLFEWQSGKAFRISGSRGSFVPGPPNRRQGSVFRSDVLERMRLANAADGASPLSDFFAFAPLYNLSALIGDQAEIVDGQVVSGNYYAGLRVRPILGRAITDADDRPGAPPVVVLSHAFWKDRFGADPAVLGRTVALNQHPFTIVGVTPPGFPGTLQVDYPPAITVPMAFEPMLAGDDSAMPHDGKPGWWWINAMGRLKPGATREQARARLAGTFQAAALEAMPAPRRDGETATIAASEYPELAAFTGSRGLREHRSTYAGTIYGLLLVVGVVLLIACANVANLLLARAAARGPEISLRLAIGAGRGRLVRQLLTESVLLASLGGAAGILVAAWGQSALAALAERDANVLPPSMHLGLDLRALAFTLAVSVACGILFGLAPAWRATGADLASALRQGRGAARHGSRLSRGLLTAQVALCLALLVGAGLVLRTLDKLRRVDVGFNQDNLLVFTLRPEQAGYRDARLADFYRRLFERLDGLPGVRSATFGRVPLIAHYGWNVNVLLPGETASTAKSHITNRQMMRENYFETLQIPRLRGRLFTAQDGPDAPHVGIVNQALAAKFFPGEDPLGKRIRDPENDADPGTEIVGVVADTKYESQREDVAPLLYTPWQQEIPQIGEMYFTLRTSGDPAALAGTVRRVVRDLDPNLPVTEVGTQIDRSRATLGQERLTARLLTFFGALALLLAAVGLSGVLAHSVARRTREIGIRMALGAQAADVRRLVVRESLGPLLTGLALGIAAAAAGTRLLGGTLYGVAALDPLTFGSVVVVLAATGLLAAYVPARRATRVDPIRALRSE